MPIPYSHLTANPRERLKAGFNATVTNDFVDQLCFSLVQNVIWSGCYTLSLREPNGTSQKLYQKWSWLSSMNLG